MLSGALNISVRHGQTADSGANKLTAIVCRRNNYAALYS